MHQLNSESTLEIIKAALDEDLSNIGDVTSNCTIPDNKIINFQISNREEIILCGVDIVLTVFNEAKTRFKNKPLTIKKHHNDGELLSKKQIIISGKGDARMIFAAERVALNLIQHLSGIATMTNLYVKKLNNKNIKILDTRKTLPLLRGLQKYAVAIGGGKNHRFALYDGILIKDNHIEAAGNITNAILMAKAAKLPIEVECDNITQVKQAVNAGADIIMLDNMNIKQIEKAIQIINKKAKIEVSGGVNLKKLTALSKLEIDYISIGGLTHSVKAVDIGLDVTK